MRKVTLWEVKPIEMMVGGYEICRYATPDSAFPFSVSGEWAVPMTPMVAVERIPIHHIRKMERGQLQEEYIAIEPRLREILELPFREEVQNAEKLAAEWHETANIVALQIANFKELPWYARAWRALRGNI